MDFAAFASLPHLFFAQAAARSDQPFLFRKRDGAWSSLSYGAVAAAIRRLAQILIDAGIAPGDRIVIVSENRPEFLIADLAVMSIGAIAVPAFVTNTIADHAYILDHSGAKAAILSTPAIAKRVLPAAAAQAKLAFLIAMEPIAAPADFPIPIRAWPQEEAPDPGTEFDRRLAALRRDTVCCFIYTSGTGGQPKAVMLTHGSILRNIRGAFDLLAEVGLGHDVFLSFLPLSHSYEHTAGQFLPIAMGAQIWYAESIERLMENMAEARPTIMTAVPRLYEVIHAKIERNLTRAPLWRQRLFRLTLRLGRQAYENPASLAWHDRLLNRLCDLLVRRAVKKHFGGRLKAFVSGGAALNYEIGIFFLALGLRLLQGYGQTEASPVISANRPNRIKIATVGPVFAGLALRIAEDGEILVRGEAVMKGYWRDEAATAAALRDGWLHTGDIGRLDEDGYLVITDRKKDIIVLSGGDNVAPARIEGLLTLQPEIGQAMIHGDGHPHLVALIVPDEEFRRQWARRRQRPDDPAALMRDSDFLKAIGATVDRVNAGLSSIEKIRRFALLGQGFTIENGQLTPSLKIRRHKIREAHRSILDGLYDRH